MEWFLRGSTDAVVFIGQTSGLCIYDIFNPRVVPFATEIFSTFILVYDNVCPHREIKVKKFIIGDNIVRMDWLAHAVILGELNTSRIT